MRSFALLRTNVGLTTNIKIVVDSAYNLSVNSIESKEELNNTKLKKVKFIKKNYFDELIPYFWKDFPTELAYHIKYENDVDSMSKDYSYQYDELYNYGAKNIVNNKEYSEEFEYFAPLYISPNNLPKKFIIFRVDGPGVDLVDRLNVKSKVFNNFKTIKIFDLTKESALGEWLDINFNNNSFFPLTPFEMSFDNLEFSKWNGIDFITGGYTSKSAFLESVYEEEKEINEFEKFIFDGYKNNKIVFPNILNLSFLFDDTPANQDNFRKWSINRYYGFYLEDMIKVKTLSPYITPFLKSDVVVQSGNILYSPSGDPFVEGFMDHKVYYVEYNGEYYKVEKFTEESRPSLTSVRINNVVTQEYTTTQLNKWRIISDIDLSGKELLLNKNTGLIGDSTTYPNRLLNYDNTNFDIEDWNTADIWLIEIDGVFHNLVRETTPEIVNGVEMTTTKIRINSDYSFSVGENDYTYYIAKNVSSEYTKKVSFIVDKNNPPKKWTIYKLKFTDIKDFDDRIVDTEFSKYEYEKAFELTDTDETKMYLPNLLSNSNPKDIDDFIYKDEVVNIPVSSEYTANYETFKIDRGELSDIWRKNSIYCRWIYQNSLSANDYPYLLNNSLIFEDYNRTVNPFVPKAERIERNLDYFYTINSSTYSYVHHTLHIEENRESGINTSFRFELDKYLNLGTYSIGTQSMTYDYDYFSYFFERPTTFNSNDKKVNVKKYSLFNSGDKSIPNITLFKGIKFIIYDVDSIKKDEEGKISALNLKTSNTFDGYKFSILLSDNEFSVVNQSQFSTSATMSAGSNLMSWTIIDDWKMDKKYNIGDIVIIDDILYQSTITNNIVTLPSKEYVYGTYPRRAKTAPYNQTGWIPILPFTNTVFWSPIGTYPGNGVGTNQDIVYNSGDYYYLSNPSGTENFWNPVISDTSGYSNGSVVLFEGKYYMSLTASNNYRPDFRLPFRKSDSWIYFWTATQSSNPRWSPIQLWNPSTQYNTSTYVVHDDVVYSCGVSGAQTGNEPGIFQDWTREYSLIPDTTLTYNTNNNPIIQMNNSTYLINTNSSNSTLENGINIYINKKWKNILININIADNTVPNLSETDRDLLYNELNDKLTAYNFINCINDLSNKYGFTDYVNYITIDENNSINKYNYTNLETLPYYITCEGPNEVFMKYNSLKYKPIEIPKELKPTKVIKAINNSLSNINDYNNIPVAAEITNNESQPVPMPNYHGGRNITQDVIYRFGGYYMPLFYDIQLFNKNFFTASVGNYKFDTSLTDFGVVKERKIRKINHKGSVLKLDNFSNVKSIYPMIDEFGYTTVDFFVFKSSWDFEYNFMTQNNIPAPIKPSKAISQLPQIGVLTPGKNINL